MGKLQKCVLTEQTNSVFLLNSLGECFKNFVILIMLTTVLSSETSFATDSFFKGDTSALIGKSTTTIKMVRFIAVFIVIGGLIWAGVEFAIKNDQQKGATVLISAVIGAFFVLLAPTIMNFVIGGIFGAGDGLTVITT